ncbi:MAG: tripartite tricarboxylate transporter TctB family protein [Deltaproteobacteria bacterium]|nr:MAG: tripartite tricarboxylate transporter TctB family protein [Deltaproteobacteria bacterium]
MRKGELIVAAIFFIIACVVVGEAFRLGFRWGLSGPQAGFVPLGEALLLMISSVVIFISGLKDKSGKTFFIDKRGMTEAVKIFGTAVLLTVGIIYLGVYVATILYAALFSRWLGKHKWTTVVIFTVILTLAIFVGMEKGLKLSLPKSPLYWKGLFFF